MKKKNYGKTLRREGVSYLMLLPNLILFIALTVYPLLWVMRYMFYDYKGYGEAVFCGFDNFIRVFTRDPVYWDSVKNTLIYSGGKLLGIVPLAFLCAVLLSKHTKPNAVGQAVIFIPTIMSSAVMALIFYLLFNTYNGDVNRFLTKLGLIDKNINWLGVKYAMTTVLIVAVWGGVGNYMVYFIAGLTGISEDVMESARLDGANELQVLFKIKMPMMAPILKIILMLALVGSFKDFQSIMVLTGGGPLGKTNVMFLHLYQLFFPLSPETVMIQEYGYGAAVAMVSAAIIGLFTLAYLFLSRKLDKIYG